MKINPWKSEGIDGLDKTSRNLEIQSYRCTVTSSDETMTNDYSTQYFLFGVAILWSSVELSLHDGIGTVVGRMSSVEDGGMVQCCQ
jgi:hypothetical protein